MRSSRKKRPGAWIGIVLASSFLLVGAMKMSAYAEPAESTETAEITESSTGAGLSDMDFGMGDGQIELDPYDQVSDFGFSDSEALQSPIASFYSLCLYLSIGGMVLSLIIAGIKLAANDSGHGKHQFLDVVGAKVIVFFSISCLVGLINLFLGILQH